MTGKLKPVTTYAILPGPNPTRRRGLARVDGRTKEAALLKATRRGLLEHLGHPPSAIEAAIIDRISWLELKCAIVEKKIATGADSEREGADYMHGAAVLARQYAALEKFAPKSAAKVGRRSVGDRLRAAAAAADVQ